MMQTLTKTEIQWVIQSMACEMEQIEDELQGDYITPAERTLLSMRLEALSRIRDKLHDTISTGSKRIAVK